MAKKVTAGVIIKDSKILIAKRRKCDFMGGKWEFPGGGLEPGETPEQCLKRELKEEFGIQTKVMGFICSNRHEYKTMSIELLVYLVHYVSGKVSLSAHDEIQWVQCEDLVKYDFCDADKPIVQKLLNGKGVSVRFCGVSCPRKRAS